MKKIYSWKLVNILFTLIGLSSILLANYYLKNICLEVGDCANYSRRGFWLPLIELGTIISIIGTMFVFFPETYFKHYIKRWFWWMFTIAYVITAATKPVGSNIGAFDRSQVVIGLGVIGLVLTLIFIYNFHKKLRQSKA